MEITTDGHLSTFTYLALALYFAAGAVPLMASFVAFKKWKKQISQKTVPVENIQFAAWIILVAAGVLVCFIHTIFIGLFVILLAQLIPRTRQK